MSWPAGSSLSSSLAVKSLSGRASTKAPSRTSLKLSVVAISICILAGRSVRAQTTPESTPMSPDCRPWVMSGRSAARLRYGLAMPPAHVSAVVVSAAADAEPVMKRRRVKGPLVTRMKRPPGIGLAPSSITSVQVAQLPCAALAGPFRQSYLQAFHPGRAAIPEERPSPRSGACDRDGDELRHVIRFQPHQHSALAILMGVTDGIAHVRRGRNFLPADIEDDVAGLEAVLGGKSIGVDLGHDHPFRAAAGDLSGRSEHQAELRHVGAAGAGVRHGGAGFAFLRQFTERQRDALLLALAPHRELDARAGIHRADLLGEITGILDRMAVDDSDDIPREDAGFGGGAVRLWLGDQRTFGSIHPEVFGNVGSDRLNLHAEPAAADHALVLELGDDRLHRLGRNIKGDANRSARRREDRGVDPDDVAVHVEGRAAGIAFVDRRVNLDEVVVGAGANVTAASRDDARRYGAA